MRKHGFRYGFIATISILIMLIGFLSPIMMSSDTFSTNAKADPPAGYNHRPINEFFTSLACPPCVNNADPAQDEVWEDWGYDPAVRYTWVVFIPIYRVRMIYPQLKVDKDKMIIITVQQFQIPP